MLMETVYLKELKQLTKNSITENIFLNLNHTYLSAKDSKEKIC